MSWPKRSTNKNWSASKRPRLKRKGGQSMPGSKPYLRSSSSSGNWKKRSGSRRRWKNVRGSGLKRRSYNKIMKVRHSLFVKYLKLIELFG